MQKTSFKSKKRILWGYFSNFSLLLLFLWFIATVPIQAQKKPRMVQLQSVSYGVPSGYTQVGTTMLYYKQMSSAIDVQGCYNGQYYGSTYSNAGYRVAIQIDNGTATSVDCLNGTTVNGVTCVASIEQQGELARICYTITNLNGVDVTVSLGTHADVMIGNNDSAPISRRIDTNGNTYGVTMKDGNSAQLCVLFGAGLAGVTSVSDFWFGRYSLNREPYQMVGNYSSGNNYMQENGSYDSGMGWCWKNRTIPAGATVVFSYLIGVGEVNLEPNSSFEVTPDDPEGWNDLSRPHKLSLEGTYESPAGLDGMIEYAVEDSEEWHQLTDMMPSGGTFNDTLVAMFDATREKHVIRFRTRDNVGNTTLLPSIEYLDVSFRQYSGITDKTYTGDSIYQEIECTDVANLEVTTGRYFNNVNAGTASFCIEGVFPYTIGRKSCTFQINPAPLSGSLNLATDSYVYNGQQFCPEWTFTNESYSTLEEGKDYSVTYTDNRYPGTAKVTVKGKSNYTSEITKTFFIDKAPLRDELFSITLPDEDVSYDGNEHKASATTNNGVGQVSFIYTLHGESTSLEVGPMEEGQYDIYMQIAEGELYYGKPTELVGSFSIYRFDETEWQSLALLYAELQQMGVTLPWDIAGGAKNVGKFEELTVKEGHVVGISLTNKEMSGLFPSSLVAFSKLEDINLSGNNLSGNISTAIAALKMQNATAFSNLHTLNLSNNKYSGNVGILGNSIPSLSNLNVSYNKFEDLYPALPANIVNIDITHQEMDRVVDLNLSELSFADMATKIPTILLYNHDIRNYNTSINLLCTKADLATFNKYDTNEWAMQLAVSDNQISIPYVSTQNAYYGESGDVLNVLNMTGNNSTDGSTFKIALSFIPGDANFDGSINILDLQSMINYMFEEYTSKPYNFTASNLWKDEVINVQDAVSMVNILLNDNNESKQLLSKSYRVADVQQEKEPTVFVSNGNLIINAAEPVSSFDIVVATDTDCEINENITSSGFSCATKQIGNQIHIVGYSLSGATLPIGENVLGRVDDGYVISSMLSDSDANEISTAFSSAPTGINYNVFSDESINEVYRINIGAKRTIVIGSNGKKYMQIEK